MVFCCLVPCAIPRHKCCVLIDVCCVLLLLCLPFCVCIWLKVHCGSAIAGILRTSLLSYLLLLTTCQCMRSWWRNWRVSGVAKCGNMAVTNHKPQLSPCSFETLAQRPRHARKALAWETTPGLMTGLLVVANALTIMACEDLIHTSTPITELFAIVTGSWYTLDCNIRCPGSASSFRTAVASNPSILWKWNYSVTVQNGTFKLLASFGPARGVTSASLSWQ